MYYLIGKTLSHSISTEIHERLGAYSYDLLELKEDELKNFFQKREFLGLNVTIPYKVKVIPYLDELRDEAKEINVVNTIIKRSGKLIGYNTDYYGFSKMLQKNNVSISKKSVAILGNGGVSKTVEYYCQNNGAKSIEVYSHNDIDLGVKTDAEIIINCTPVGKFGWDDKSPIDFEYCRKVKCAIDLIYNPYNTRFLRDAKKWGAMTINGLYMLIAQAKKASELFTDTIIDDDIIDSLYDEFSALRQNIVIIGMGGAGKTSIGACIAKRLNRVFIDTDDLISKRVGMDTSKYILSNGESAFRTVENEVIKGLLDTHGSVIATGGGVVINDENIDILRRNGIIVFLDTPIKYLDTKRPLYKSADEINKIYNARIEKYLNADIKVTNDRTKNIEEIAKEIIDEAFSH